MSISTLSLNNANRATLMRLQTELRDASKELTTERHADVGLALGRLTGTAVSYRVQETSIDAQLETNKVIAGRLDFAQDSMKAIADGADNLSKALLGAEKYNDYPALARSALQQMQGALNTPINGLYVFGGENAGVPPVKDIDAGIVAAKDAFATYLASIGKTGQAGQVTAAEMTTFLTGGFLDTVNNDAAWSANWSSAFSKETEAAISRSETIQTSLSANAKAFRDVTAAYSMLAAIGGEDLNDEARKAMAQEAAKRLGTGTSGLTTLRASVGVRQARVDAADDALTRQKDIVNSAFSRLEGVDQTEAGLRVTQLETQLQASYTVTGRLQKLTILDYL